MDRKVKLEQFKSNPIYFVTCEELSEGRTDEDVVEAVLEGGIRLIQLRDKISSKKVIYQKAIRIRELTRRYDALMIMNDHLDIALMIGADGVHLGQDDLPVNSARNLSGKVDPTMMIGLSTHDKNEIHNAHSSEWSDFIDYINVGPLFPTKTKENEYHEVDENIWSWGKEIEKPFSVMGGIKQQHLAELRKSFPQTPIAMITEITKQQNITEHVKLLLENCKEMSLQV